ncbi:2-amino-4-hydroxy-6-hydroxymethyldihydropteridine diphosphokinase [Aurantivibrio plasticivorans]
MKTPSPNTTVQAYIALGSNLSDPLSQVSSAVEQLKCLPNSRVTALSAWYRSKAIGPGEQPDYINGALQLDTQLSPHQLLEHTQSIEANHGRERRIRWAARTLDLDILLFGDQTLDSDNLQIPHPRLTERNFVLYPLADIDPDMVFPDGTQLSTLISQSSMSGLQRLAPEATPPNLVLSEPMK